jgi:hypothetical protein
MNAATRHARTSQTYQVPQRFGAGGMMSIIFVFSLLFGSLHFMDAHGGYYLFFSVLGLVVGISQMRGTRSPRWASIVAGAIVLPPAIFLAIATRYNLERAIMYLPLCLLSSVFGAGIGYLAGTILGGAFLIADYLEQYFDPRENRPAREPKSDIVLAEDVTELRARQQKWELEQHSIEPTENHRSERS